MNGPRRPVGSDGKTGAGFGWRGAGDAGRRKGCAGTRILSVTHVCKQYGDFVALNDISFSAHQHEILGLVGPSGAGQTSTIDMILGVLEPTSWSVTIQGFDVRTGRPRALARSNFAAIYAPLPGNLTGEQDLRIFGMRFQRLHVERLFGDDVPQATILVFQLLQALHLTELQSAVLRSSGSRSAR